MTSSNNEKIPVAVAGALGKMGGEVVKAVTQSNEFELIAAIDNSPNTEGLDVGDSLGLGELGIAVTSDLEGSLCSISQAFRDSGDGKGAVFVDFTHPNHVYENTRASIAYGIKPVIGTTGLSSEQIKDLQEFSIKASVGGAIIPNFSVGMVLLQQAAAAAASFYDYAELTESHHIYKADAPSGTCIKTAEIIEEISNTFNSPEVQEKETLLGCRGGKRNSGLRIHSIRVPGIVAQQQVLFGSSGETYSLVHNTIDRSAYMPGVLLTIKKVRFLKSLVYGLEKLL